MVGTLRVNPEAYTGEYVNTMHRVLIPIYEKYPNCLVFIRQEGVREDTKLFELNYNAAVPETPESE
jgi:hypothetical protein